MEERYVAAIELSSSKIIAGVGCRRPDGRLDVIALEQERALECVRRGFIHNIDETYIRLQRILEKLQRRPSIAPKRITSAFVGISGRSMRSIAVETALNLPEDTIISQEILDKLRAQAAQHPLEGSLEIVDIVPRKYVVDKTETTSPKGSIGSHILATFDLIVCRPELCKNIERTVEAKLGLPIEGFIVTPLAAAHLVLTDDQKRLGCLMADIGAETTSVTIYKHGALCYYATLPMGSRNITRDITTLSLLEEHAEEIKISSGNAIPPETRSTINISGVKLSDVSDLVVARSEEIVANIVAQIQYAGLKNSDLPGGIITLGGGAKMKGMNELLARQTDLSVKSAEIPQFVHIEEVKIPTQEATDIVSLLYSAATKSEANCLEIQAGEELPVNGETPDDEDPEEEPREGGKRQKGPQILGDGFFGKLKKRIGSIFTPEDDDFDDELSE